MAVRISDGDLAVHGMDDSPRRKREGPGKKGITARQSSCMPPSPSKSHQPALQTPSSSLPAVSDLLNESGGILAPVAPQHHPLTGQLEPRVVRHSRLSDLMSDVRSTFGISETVSKHLEDADNFIIQRKNAEAIPCLEAALLATGDTPKLQCLLWRLLGNAHLSLGHFKKASVCHMHQVAFCRELDDFVGMTMAECNLGIAYMRLGLLKLAGRCFVQYLNNSRVLMDEMGIAYAYSNLGVLSKMMGVEEYHKLEGSDRTSKSRNKQGMEGFKSHIQKAIGYFEQHLEIVERHSDL